MKMWVKTAILFFIPALLWGCGVKDDYDIPAQQTEFKDFLEAIERPYVTSLAQEKNIYKDSYGTSGTDLFIEAGDSVYISYSGYAFNKSNKNGYGFGSIFTTNILEDAYEAGWYPSDLLPITPVFFIQGKGQVIKGIDQGVAQSAKGDSIRLYLTSNLAYGGDEFGFLKPGTPVVFKVYIEDVKKK